MAEGKREARPGGEAAEPAGARQADGEADLARRRTGQELGERDEIGEGALGQPAAPRDELSAEITEMGDRPAERGEAELEEGEEDVERRAGPSVRLRRPRLASAIRPSPANRGGRQLRQGGGRRQIDEASGRCQRFRRQRRREHRGGGEAVRSGAIFRRDGLLSTACRADSFRRPSGSRVRRRPAAIS